MKDIRTWLHAKSETFSSLVGESFTHREVLLVNGIFVCGMVGAMVADKAIIVTLLTLATAVFLAWQLNDK